MPPYFDAVAFSDEARVAKPDAGIYLAACGSLGVAPQECVYVGDGADDELEGAAALGMRVIRTVEHSAVAHSWTGPTVAALPELSALLGPPSLVSLLDTVLRDLGPALRAPVERTPEYDFDGHVAVAIGGNVFHIPYRGDDVDRLTDVADAVQDGRWRSCGARGSAAAAVLDASGQPPAARVQRRRASPRSANSKIRWRTGRR